MFLLTKILKERCENEISMFYVSELITQIREFLRTEVAKEFEQKEKDDM